MTIPTPHDDCPRCHGEGVTAAPHIVDSAWSHTMTACTCLAGQQFKAAMAAKEEK